MPRVGLISDTHGLLRPEARAFLAGCDHIIHAGDIGDGGILDALAAIAPLTGVRGNNDQGPWAEHLPDTARVVVGGVTIHVVHDIADWDPAAAGGAVHVVVTGHSHQPKIERREGVLFVNPGSAGRRRFKLPVAAAELRIDARAGVSARIVDLLHGASA